MHNIVVRSVSIHPCKQACSNQSWEKVEMEEDASKALETPNDL